jgi:hypothetical protein
LFFSVNARYIYLLLSFPAFQPSHYLFVSST